MKPTKLSLLMLAAMGSNAALAKPAIQAESRVTRECPANLLQDVVLQNTLLQSREVFVHEGEVVSIDRYALGEGASCAIQTAPTRRSLLPDDGLLKSRVAGQMLQTLSGGKEPKPPAPSTSWACNVRGRMIQVLAGRCGSGGGSLGTAFFVAPNFALSGGPQWTNHQGEACLVEGTSSNPQQFYDVHTVQKTGAANTTLVGLSLMQPGPGDSGVQAVGPLFTPPNGFTAASVEGKYSEYGFLCQSGPVDFDSNGWARLNYGLVNDPIQPYPVQLSPGGPAFVGLTSQSPPMGVHTADGYATYPYFYYLPYFKRFSNADVGLIGNWMATAAPGAGQAIQISAPADGVVVNANLPLQVNVDTSGGYALELDGVPVSNPITGLTVGAHTLAAYKPSAPQYRHTIRFSAQAQVVADEHESDNVPEAYKPVFANTPKYHTFHQANDVDWSAFGIGNGSRVNIAMNGGAFGQCSMTLYRHADYPAGSREQVASTAGACTGLFLSYVTPTAPSTQIYFLETRLHGNYTGNNTNYQLFVTASQEPAPADAYENDDKQIDYVPLFQGSPQQHNLHQEGDTDWTAFAVGVGVGVQVSLTGTGADRSRARLYRQTDYPNGPIELIGTSEGMDPLLLNDRAVHEGPFTVYYVETAAVWSGFYGIAANYSISVDTY